MASPGDESQKFPERHADGACPQPRDRAARLEPAKRGQSFFLFEKSIALLLGKAYSLYFFLLWSVAFLSRSDSFFSGHRRVVSKRRIYSVSMKRIGRTYVSDPTGSYFFKRDICPVVV